MSKVTSLKGEAGGARVVFEDGYVGSRKGDASFPKRWFPSCPARFALSISCGANQLCWAVALNCGHSGPCQLRWLKDLKVSCVYLRQSSDADYVWRRVQVSQVQAERQRKSVLQLCLVFHARAEAIHKDR